MLQFFYAQLSSSSLFVYCFFKCKKKSKTQEKLDLKCNKSYKILLHVNLGFDHDFGGSHDNKNYVS